MVSASLDGQMHTVTSSGYTAGLVGGLDARRLAESLPEMVWVNRADGGRVYLNGRGAGFVGMAPEDTYGWSWMNLVHPDDVTIVRLGWERAIGEHTRYEADFRIRNADGDYRWIASRGVPVFASDDTVENWVGTWTDIDDAVRRDEDLRRLVREATQTSALLDTLQSKAPVGFLFVDRKFRYVRVNEMMAAINGASVGQHLGRTVAEVVPQLWPQIKPLYRHIMDSGESVLDVEISGETAATGGDIRHWLASFYPVRTGEEIIGIGVVVVDITERVQAEEAMKSLTEAAVDAIAAAVEARDPYTAGHQRRVADLAVAIATNLGLDQHATEGVRLAAKIHDIGKISTPAEILSKPGKLTASELALVKDHPQTGHDIVQGINFPWPIADMIGQHHERVDGSGYPNGLAGNEITIGARIIAVADVVEAMASHRPYRPSKGIADALRQIEHDRGTLFDAEAVDVCLRLFRQDHYSFRQRQ